MRVLALLLFSSMTYAQVGINTTDPKGIVDFNSTTLGVVYPNVALTATDDPSPVINPQGGALAIGTAVYNTNTTTTGAITDVHPGVYVWDGSEWRIHFRKRQSELFNQTAVLRPEANFASDWEDVPGLGIADNNTFTAKYSGLYRIEVKTNFGAGKTELNGSSFVAMASGQFRLLFDGTPYTFETSAFSAYTTYLGSGSYYENIWKESYETRYLYLTAGTTYDFSLCFDAYDAPGFIGNGSTTTTLTSVDLINEDFESGYVVVQNHTPDPQCPTDGWVNSNNPATSCPACAGNTLNIDAGNTSNCQQDATALMSFTPTVSSVDISFDWLFDYRNGSANYFRAYLYDEVLAAQVGADLVYATADDDGSYSGTIAVVAGNAHTLRFEYVNPARGNFASVDHVVVSELSGPPGPSTGEGRGYVGNDVDCQIEITYIGE